MSRENWIRTLRAHRDVGFVLRRRAEDDFRRRRGRDANRLGFDRRRFGRRLAELDAVAGDLEPLQPAAHVRTTPVISSQRPLSMPRVEREVEAFAFRLRAADPDGRVGRAQHEIVSALAGRIRQVAEQIPPAELAGDRHLLIDDSVIGCSAIARIDGVDRQLRLADAGRDDGRDLAGPRPRRRSGRC